MICCYILFSENLNCFYIGVSHNDPNDRLLKHNNHSYGTHRFTAKTNDWVIYHFIECPSFAVALKLEKHIKRMKSKTYIQNLRKFPEIANKLLTNTKYEGVRLSR